MRGAYFSPSSLAVNVDPGSTLGAAPMLPYTFSWWPKFPAVECVGYAFFICQSPKSWMIWIKCFLGYHYPGSGILPETGKKFGIGNINHRKLYVSRQLLREITDETHSSVLLHHAAFNLTPVPLLLMVDHHSVRFIRPFLV